MRFKSTLFIASLIALTSCLNVEDEPLITINPTATISAHIKNQKIYTTALVDVNPQVQKAGNISMRFTFEGELAIYNTINGNIIDVHTFTGGGLSQAYTVTADTLGRERFVVIASGSIKAFADSGNDGDPSNDRLISSGDFYQEESYLVSELVNYSSDL